MLHQSLGNLGNDVVILSREAARMADRLETMQRSLQDRVRDGRLADVAPPALQAQLQRWVGPPSPVPNLMDVAVVDPDGQELAAAGHEGPGRHMGSADMAQRVDLHRVRRGQAAFGRVVFGPHEPPSIVMAFPVQPEQESRRVVLARFGLQRVLAEFRELFRKVDGTAYVLDEQGRVVSLSSGGSEGDLSPPGRAVTASVGETVELLEDNGASSLRTRTTVGHTGWQLLWERPLRAIVDQTSYILEVTAVIFLASLLVAILVGFRFVRKISDPVHRLTQATQHIAEGRYDEQIPHDLGVRDELETLAASFEKMRLRLRHTMQENARLYQKTRDLLHQRIDELKALHTASEAISGALDLQDLLDTVTDQASDIVNPRFINLYLVRREQGLDLQVSRGLTSDDLKRLFTCPLTLGTAHLVPAFETLRPLLVPRLSQHTDLCKRLPTEGVEAYAAVPLVYGGRVLGLMEIGFREGAAVTEETASLLGTLGREAGIAVHNLMLYLEVVEERNRNHIILESMGDGVYTVDSEMRITSFNAAAQKITGYSAAEAIGRPCWEIFHGHDSSGELVCSPDRCIVRASFRGVEGDEIPEYELRIRTPEGKQRTVLLHPSQSKGAETGSGAAVVSLFRDVSRLREIEDLRSAFMSTVSHELRTPLTSIKGCVSTLMHPKARFDKEATHNFLSIINEEADRLHRLINDLLEASRLETSRLVIQPQDVALGRLAEKVVAQQRKLSPRHDITLEGDLDVHGYCDPGQMDYVLGQLVGNAVKYSPGGGTVAVSLASVDGWTEVTVRDQGVGIPAEEFEHIFEPFHRVDRRDTRVFYGAGLGLFIARRVVEAHGGRIRVESVVSGGSCFTFTVPTTQREDGKLAG